MSLLTYKWLIAGILVVFTLLTSLISLHFIGRYRQWLQRGDALADGIFLGVAAFHLFPNAVSGIARTWPTSTAYVLTLLLVGSGFILLFFLERWFIIHEEQQLSTTTTDAWILLGVLSIHAFISGATLGIAGSMTGASLLFIAILAHKGFESFALAVGLHRRWQRHYPTTLLLTGFAGVTPIGIILASFIDHWLQIPTAEWLSSIFNAFAAGTFLYIGTWHAMHDHFDHATDANPRYHKWLWTVIGIAVMGALAFWQ